MNKLFNLSILALSLVGCGKDLDKPKADQSIGLSESPSKIEDLNYSDDFRKNLNTNDRIKKNN